MAHPSSFTALLVALVIAGCGPGAMFEATPSIRGEIRALIASTGGSDLGFARIEGERHADTEYDKADVTITRTTTITRVIDGVHESIPFDSLRVGMVVDATFTGPVMESYPVRATAATIVVTKE